MRKLLEIVPWIVICLAFFSVGMLIRVNVSSDFGYELLGYDYGKYTFYFSDLNWISYMPFRHPLLGVISSPFVLIFNRVADTSQLLYCIFLHLTFAALGTFCVWMVKQIAGWVGALIFITFPFVWIVSAVPESYAVSMCVLLTVVWWALNQNNYGLSYIQKLVIWVLLFILAGGVTLTNGLKVIVTYVISNNLTKRQFKKLFFFLLIFCIAGVVFFAVRMWLWNVMHPKSQKTISHAVSVTLRWMSTDMTFGEWCKSVMFNFVLYPLTLGYGLASIWAVVIYGMSCVNMWVSRKERITWILLGMFSVDLVIHVICRWALDEAWIFSPHWIWIMPIIIGIGMRKFQR
jgi:hypothetical protein